MKCFCKKNNNNILLIKYCKKLKWFKRNMYVLGLMCFSVAICILFFVLFTYSNTFEKSSKPWFFFWKPCFKETMTTSTHHEMDTLDGQTTYWIENNLSTFCTVKNCIFSEIAQHLHKKFHKANVFVQSLDCLHFSLGKREVKDLQHFHCNHIWC